MTTPILIWLFNPHTNDITVVRRSCWMPSPALESPQDFLQWLHPDEHPRFTTHLQASGGTCRFKTHTRWKTLKGTPLEDTAVALGDGSGLILHTTQRMRPELNHGLAQRVLDQVPDPVFVKDRNHTWIMLNDAMCAFMGYPREELLGKSDFDFFPPEEASVFHERDEMVFESRKLDENVEFFTDANGQRHTISTKKTVFKDSSHPDVLIGVIRDITRIPQTPATLKQTQADLQHMLDTAPYGLCVSGKNGIIYANEELTKTLGKSRQELQGLRLTTLLQLDAAPNEFSAQCAIPVAGEHTLKENNTHRHIEISTARRIQFNHQDASLVMVRDQTSKRSLQTRLEVAERMASMGQLAAGVAHEINNPLTYIQTNIELCLEELQNLNPNTIDMRDWLRDAQKGTQQATTVVAQLQSAARPIDQPQHFDLKPVIDWSLQLTHNQLRHCCTLHTDIPSDLPQVQGNTAQLTQVLINLITNAIGAFKGQHHNRNTLTIKALTDGPEHLLVHIKDNGVGISPQHLRRIFDPFFTTKDVGSGMGLGLFLSQNIIQSMGGSMEFNSTQGQGTTVTLRLLTAQGDTPQPHAKPNPNPKPHNPDQLKVLIIDDDALILRSLSRVLRKHNVSTATNGAQALKLLQNDPHFDTIICDVMMPHMNGIEVLSAIQDQHPQLAPRFIFLTGGTFTLEQETTLKNLPNLVLKKPITPKELSSSLRSLVAHSLRE